MRAMVVVYLSVVGIAGALVSRRTDDRSMTIGPICSFQPWIAGFWNSGPSMFHN